MELCQNARSFKVAKVASVVKGSFFLLIGEVYGGTILEKHPDDSQEARVARVVQRGASILK